MLRGVDVSDWQPGIDWRAAAAAGFSFGFTKATEGLTNRQDTLEANRAGMAEAGLHPVGLYHFARPDLGNDPTAEADHFCDAVGPLRPGELAVLDIERGSPPAWPAFITTWCARVAARLGGAVAVYMSESPAKTMPAECARWPLWVAGYVDDTPVAWEEWAVGPWASPAVWQYTDAGAVPGIGSCDCNVAPDDVAARLGVSPPAGRGATVGWPELDRYLAQLAVVVNQPPEDWQTTGGTHVSTSWHYPRWDAVAGAAIGHARDYSSGMGCDEAGVVAALAPLAVPGGAVVELFHAGTGTWLKDGVDIGPIYNDDGSLSHTDHVHAAIAPGTSLPLLEDDMADPDVLRRLDRIGDELERIRQRNDNIDEQFVIPLGDGDGFTGLRRLADVARWAWGKAKRAKQAAA